MGLEVELDLYLYLYLYLPLMLIPLTPTSIYLSIYLSIYRYNMEGVWDWKLGKFRQKFSNVRSLVA